MNWRHESFVQRLRLCLAGSDVYYPSDRLPGGWLNSVDLHKMFAQYPKGHRIRIGFEDLLP